MYVSFNPTSPLGWGGLGLRLFQSSNWEGLPFPLPPSLGCGSRGSRGVIGHLFGARFEPPFFTTWDPPKSLSQVISAPKRSHFEVRNGVQNKLPLRNWLFLYFFSVFSFFHTTSSASRIAPAISKPHFRLSSFLLFLLSLRPSFWRVFGYKMGTKTNPKTEPETGPLKKLRSSERKIPCSKKGTKMVPQKGVPCGLLASSMLCCCFLLDFGAFRAYFGR